MNSHVPMHLMGFFVARRGSAWPRFVGVMSKTGSLEVRVGIYSAYRHSTAYLLLIVTSTRQSCVQINYTQTASFERGRTSNNWFAGSMRRSRNKCCVLRLATLFDESIHTGHPIFHNYFRPVEQFLRTNLPSAPS